MGGVKFAMQCVSSTNAGIDGVALIECVRDIPFAFVPDRSVSFMLRWGAGSCTPKHRLLKQLLTAAGVQSRLSYVTVKLDRERLTFLGHSPVARGRQSFSHTTLEVKTPQGWRVTDVTFDRFIASVAPVHSSVLDGQFDLGEILTSVPASDQVDRRARLQLQFQRQLMTREQRRHFWETNKWLHAIRRPFMADVIENCRRLEAYLADSGQAPQLANRGALRLPSGFPRHGDPLE